MGYIEIFSLFLIFYIIFAYDNYKSKKSLIAVDVILNSLLACLIVIGFTWLITALL